MAESLSSAPLKAHTSNEHPAPKALQRGLSPLTLLGETSDRGHIMGHIRSPAFAGSFYPAEPAKLAAMLDFLIASNTVPSGSAPKALIAPHAGYIYSGAIAAGAYGLWRDLRGTVKRVVLLGPSHRVAFRGFALCSAQAYGSPLGPMLIDEGWNRRALAMPGVRMFDDAHGPEHSLEVHIPFLQTVLGHDVALVPVVCGEALAGEVADLLDALWGGPETLIVISSDLSHFLDYDACRALDGKTAATIEALSPHALGRDQACGRVGIGGMVTAAKRRGMAVRRLGLCNSGDSAGPRDRVVGYGAWGFWDAAAEEGRDAEAMARNHGGMMLDIAWQSVSSGLKAGCPLGIDLAACPPDLRQEGASFVTLKKNGILRGCIGSVLAHRPLAVDLAENAFRAAFHDPRFPPLDETEVAGLGLSVSLLSRPQSMTFRDEADLLAQLTPHRDGLIIEDGGRRAVFLPAVWQSLPDKKVFLAQLKRKAGLAPDHWSPSFTARRFGAVEIRR